MRKAGNPWGCTHTHTHTHTGNLKTIKNNNNLIGNKIKITRNLCYGIFDFVQKCVLCKQ